jgi:hypothetical protein
MNKGRFLVSCCITIAAFLTATVSADAQQRIYGGRAAGVISYGSPITMAGDTGELSIYGGAITHTTPRSSMNGIATGTIVSSTSGAGDASQSSSTVSNTRIVSGGYTITAISVSANSQCICCPGSAEPGCTGNATASGVVVTDPSGTNTTITANGSVNQVVQLPGGGGTITFNEQVTGNNQLAVTGMRVRIGAFDAAIAYARSLIICGGIGPSPAEVNVSGRVVSATGVGIANARVVMTSPTGTQHQATTNHTGAFTVTGITAGHSYSVEASAKSYSFPSMIIEVMDEIDDLEIRANP